MIREIVIYNFDAGPKYIIIKRLNNLINLKLTAHIAESGNQLTHFEQRGITGEPTINQGRRNGHLKNQSMPSWYLMYMVSFSYSPI